MVSAHRWLRRASFEKDFRDATVVPLGAGCVVRLEVLITGWFTVLDHCRVPSRTFDVPEEHWF